MATAQELLQRKLGSLFQSVKSGVSNLVQRDLSPAPGTQSIAGIAQNWQQFTPLSMKSQAVPLVSGALTSIGIKPEIAQDIGYATRGALSLTPFQSNPLMTQMKPAEQLTVPTTTRQKMAQAVGQAAYGNILTAPIRAGQGGFKIATDIAKTSLAGVGTGTLMGAGSDILSGRMPTKQSLIEGGISGLQNSWVLPITNKATDLVLSGMSKLPMASGLKKIIGEAATDPFKQGQIKEGFTRLLAQSLAQVPAENTAFTALNQLNDQDQEEFTKAWMKNLPGAVLSNILSAGVSGGTNIVMNKESRDAVIKAAQDVLNKPTWTYEPTDGGFYKWKQEPWWKSKMKNPRLGLSTEPINPEQRIKIQENKPKSEPLPWEADKQEKIPVLDKQTVDENLATAVMSEDAQVHKDILKNWLSKKEVAKTTGAQAGYAFKDIPQKQGMDFIGLVEGTKKSSDPVLQQKAAQWKQATNALYQDVSALAKQNGQDAGFLENYVTHMWKDDPQVVVEKLRRVGKKFKFANPREIPTYEEGIKAGLTPRYTNPSQIMSEYVRNLEQTKANLSLLSDLKNNGLIVSGAEARTAPGFEPLFVPGFPRKTTKVGGRTIESNWYAPSQVARDINQLFRSDPGNKVLDSVANFTRKFQDVTLSGGLPYTPINAFTAAQIQKELLSGRVISPVRALFADDKFFFNQAEQIKKMQQRGVAVNSTLDTAGLMPNNKTWSAAVNDPTFKRFMPALQINLFNDIERQAVKSGMNPNAAADVAANAVKNFYATPDLLKEALATTNEKNLTSSLFFAPKFRQAMVGFWVNSLKAIKNPLALENRNNLKFLAGSAITFGAMNYLNNALNGHNMWENPTGKEDKLLIPAGETTVGIPFLSSIATVPRGLARIGKAVVTGDYAKAAKDAFQTFSAGPVKIVGDIMSNEDYFGKQIYNPDSSPLEKQTDVAKYIGTQLTGHPWLKTALKAGGQPVIQSITQALELPIRYYKTDTIQNAPFWEQYNTSKKIVDQFEQLKYKAPGQAVKFYNDNKAAIDGMQLQKDKVSAYYDSGKNSEFLKQNGVIKDDQHYAFTGTDGKFHLIDKDFSMPEVKLTGMKLIDDKLLSSYSSEITAKEKNVVTLFTNGVISADEANSSLEKLENLRAVAKSKKTKTSKPKKVSIRKVSLPAQKAIKIGTIKMKSAKLKLKRPKFGKVPVMKKVKIK